MQQSCMWRKVKTDQKENGASPWETKVKFRVISELCVLHPDSYSRHQY